MFVIVECESINSANDQFISYSATETDQSISYRQDRVTRRYFVTPTLKSVDEILWCCHSNETSSAVLSYATICLVCFSNFEICE